MNMNCTVALYSNGVMKGDPIAPKVVVEAVDKFLRSEKKEMFFQKREDSLMYYAYLYKVKRDKNVFVEGLFLCYNGVMLKNPLSPYILECIDWFMSVSIKKGKAIELIRECFSQEELFANLSQLDYGETSKDLFISQNEYHTTNDKYKATNTILSVDATLSGHRTIKEIEYKKRSVILFWVAIFLLLIIVVIVSVLLNTESSKAIKYSDEKTQLSSELKAEQEKYELLKTSFDSTKYILAQTSNALDEILTETPFIIEDIEIANVDYYGNIETDYGGRITEDYTMYLKPRITYRAYTDGEYYFNV